MKYGWFGNYKLWSEATDDTKGYNDKIIFEKTKTSIHQVIAGKSPYERDTVLFERIEYEYHQTTITGLMKLSIDFGKTKINVLDFGGSLGTLYFATRNILNPIQLEWNIVEQKHYVDYGKNNIPFINFYNSIEDCLKNTRIDVIILSSVLQYMEEPYELIASILSNNIKYIILERTAILPNGDILTIQKVPPDIYDSSYPAWFLNELKVLSLFDSYGYNLIADFKEICSSTIPNSQFKGYIYAKND